MDTRTPYELGQEIERTERQIAYYGDSQRMRREVERLREGLEYLVNQKAAAEARIAKWSNLHK